MSTPLERRRVPSGSPYESAADAFRALGAGRANVVRARVDLRHAEDGLAVALAHLETFGGAPPASAVVGAGRRDPRERVELEAAAFAP